VEALLLAILDGYHALYKVGARLADRGMLPLLQPGLQRASLHDYRLGQILDALFAANLNRVFGAIALNALEVYTLTNPVAPSGYDDDHPLRGIRGGGSPRHRAYSAPSCLRTQQRWAR
jgi:hypothetical protein